MDRLLAHNWPGNIRELRACLFDAVNRHPDVEHLVPGHLRITSDAGRQAAISVSPPEEKADQAQPADPRTDLSALLAMNAGMRFDQGDIAQWSGRLADLQHTQAWVLARYLQAALDATKRRTPEHPEGVLQIYPAVKLITGDAGLTASKAADVIKRLLGPLEEEL